MSVNIPVLSDQQCKLVGVKDITVMLSPNNLPVNVLYLAVSHLLQHISTPCNVRNSLGFKRALLAENSILTLQLKYSNANELKLLISTVIDSQIRSTMWVDRRTTTVCCYESSTSSCTTVFPCRQFVVSDTHGWKRGRVCITYKFNRWFRWDRRWSFSK